LNWHKKRVLERVMEGEERESKRRERRRGMNEQDSRQRVSETRGINRDQR
jgi:hypothetical protein